MNAKTKGLGRGLGAIFEIEGSALPEKTKRSAFEEIEIDRIAPNPKQPRTHFGEQALDELAESIRTLGVIQPITVRKEADGRYTIISGERRWRASKLAGLTSMPAYIREADRGIHARDGHRREHSAAGPQCDRSRAEPFSGWSTSVT